MKSEMIQRLEAFLESEEGKASIEEWKRKDAKEQEIRAYQLLRIKKLYTDEASFTSLMLKVIEKNGDDYQDKCYKKGYMPHPNNVLSRIHDVADCEGIDHTGIDEFTAEWPADICTYLGWQFAVTHGQGSVTSVYHNRKLLLRL